MCKKDDDDEMVTLTMNEIRKSRNEDREQKDSLIDRYLKSNNLDNTVRKKPRSLDEQRILNRFKRKWLDNLG